MATKRESLTFKAADGHELAARLQLPLAGKPQAYAIFAHCFSCGKDVVAANRISESLADLGIAVLRFDFTGLGKSEGDFADTNFSTNLSDLLAAADFLRNEHEAPSLLIGHSLGGAAVLAVASEMPEVNAVVTIGAPAEPAHVSHLFDNVRDRIEETGEAEISLGAGKPLRVKKQFLADLEKHSAKRTIPKLKRALLVMHAPLDTIVGIENAGEIFGAAKHPKSFISLDGADHLLTRREDASYAAQVISGWASKYLDIREEAPIKARAGEVVVRTAADGKFAQRISAGPHALRADEPAAYGGDESGPTPYDLLLAGLGACTSMTIKMYADRKKWPVENVEVTMTHNKIHAEECGSCETADGKIDHIHRRIHIEGDLDADQRERLLEIADKCPVHKTLHAEVHITTEEA
jgi:uncharacterized OsmC-like protein/alpha-beta hydrolase superfamily lysophospholipase